MSEPVIALPNLLVGRAAPDVQLLLHCEPHDADVIAASCGLALPGQMLTSSTRGGWSSLHLAPDEWLLIGTEDGSALSAAIHAARRSLSLVDISDRSATLEVRGERWADLLAGGCPLDSAMLVEGTCTRTMFGKVMVMLWRRGAVLRMSYARSFDDYVVELARAIAADLADEDASA